MKARIPENEATRLEELRAYSILDTLPEQAYDDITFLAAQIARTPIALVSLVDGDRQWFKSRVGLDATQTPRDLAFCAHAILAPQELLIVPDATADQRFHDNALVLGDPNIRFYAGAPLVTSSGNALGTLCVIDRERRDLEPDQLESLRALSRQVIAQLELRRTLVELQKQAEEEQRYKQMLETYQAKLEEKNSKLRSDSITDALTGLANRRALMERLQDEVHRARRYGRSLSLALIDVDHFKRFNDLHGHQRGDDVLRTVACHLREFIRQNDFVARYGGEEFALLMPDTEAEGAFILAERLRRSVESADWPAGAVTVSLGISALEEEIESPEHLLSRADKALYHAKGAGRNRVCDFSQCARDSAPQAEAGVNPD